MKRILSLIILLAAVMTVAAVGCCPYYFTAVPQGPDIQTIETGIRFTDHSAFYQK